MFPADPSEPKLISWMRNKRVRRTLVLSLLWLFVAVVLVRFRFVLLPFGVAVLIAFIIEPLVAAVSKRNIAGKPIPRIVSIISIYLVGIGLGAVFSTWTLAQIGDELAGLTKMSKSVVTDLDGQMDGYLDKIETFAKDNNLPFRRSEVKPAIRENLRGAVSKLTENATRVFTFGKDLVGFTFQAIFGIFLVLMLTAFISMDKDRINRALYSLVPPEYQPAYTQISSGASVGLAGVVRGQVMICLTNGILTFVGLWLLNVPLPLIMGTVAAVFSLIPIFGSILSTIPIVLLALTDGWAKGVFALFWIIGIHLIEANLLNPKIMGDAAKIHPVIVVFALLVGEQTAGLKGALFAVPITSVIMTVFKFLHQRALEVDTPSEIRRAETSPPSPQDGPLESAPKASPPEAAPIESQPNPPAAQ